MKPRPLLFSLCTLLASFAACPAQMPAPDGIPVYKDPAAPVESRVEDLLQRLTADEKIKMLGGTGFTKQPIERLGVPAFQMSDASVGVRREMPSPVYVPAGGADGGQAVREADAVIVCVGFDDHNAGGGNYGDLGEHEGADRRYLLPGGQTRLLLAVAALDPHVVVVLNTGGSVEMASWIEHVPALLHAYYPGADGNTALAEIIFGRTNPSDRLPFSWEKRWEDSAAYSNYPTKEPPASNMYREGVFLGYRWFDVKDKGPLFPFGFGLSYTAFALSDLQAARSGPDEVELSVAVRNTGTSAGAEVVQIYAAPPAGALPRPARELKAYGKVFLQPGETRTVLLKLRCADLAAWDSAGKRWTLFPGDYVFQAGGEFARRAAAGSADALSGQPACCLPPVRRDPVTS